jgi:hypothetical protein
MERRRETEKGEVEGETNGEYRKRTGTKRQRKVLEIKRDAIERVGGRETEKGEV